jgi:hypothetical protein
MTLWESVVKEGIRQVMTYEKLVDGAHSLQGKTLYTVKGKPFRVGVYMECPFFTPESSGVGRSDGRLAAHRFVERYNETGSLRGRDYLDITRNSSYYVALMERLATSE